MKWFSRSTFGVIIGTVSILFYIIGVSIVTIQLLDDNAEPSNAHSTSKTIILSTILSVCLLMLLMSGLLIVGIIKRRHKLMWPWLALSGIGFVCNCIKILCGIIFDIANGSGLLAVLTLVIGGIFEMALQALILWPIYTLCRDIGEKNKKKSGKVLPGANYSHVTLDAPPKYSYENLWPVYTLSHDIAEKNNEKVGQVLPGANYGYVTPDAPPKYSYDNLSPSEKF